MLKSVYKSIKIEFEYDSRVFFLSKTDFKTCMNLYTAEHTQDANEVVCRKFHLGILIIFVNKINNLMNVMCQGAFRRIFTKLAEELLMLIIVFEILI